MASYNICIYMFPGNVSKSCEAMKLIFKFIFKGKIIEIIEKNEF